MKHYQHILCLIDFSPASNEALVRASWLRDITGASLTVAHFVQPYPVPTYAFAIVDGIPNLIEEAKKHTAETLEKYGVENVVTVVEDNAVRQGITALINQSDIDLIVIGRHGEHSLADKLLGSTSHYVINNATCDVIVTHETTKCQPVGGDNPVF